MRSIIDAAQGQLALLCGLATDGMKETQLPHCWRTAINHKAHSDKQRLRNARTLLAPKKDIGPIKALLADSDAMCFLTQESGLRNAGNEAAHRLEELDVLEAAVNRTLVGEQRVGMLKIIHFIEATQT
jgi:hypothetical protein